LSHVVSREATTGNYPMTLTRYFEAGNYYLWARAYHRGGSERAWNISLNSYMFGESFGDEGGLGYIWESGGSYNIPSSGDYEVQIIDADPDGYWAYPDIILFTTNSTYDPNDCGDDIFAFRQNENFTESYDGYNNYNCNLGVTSASASFSLNGIADGSYNWQCRGINDLGIETSTGSRGFSVGSGFQSNAIIIDHSSINELATRLFNPYC